MYGHATALLSRCFCGGVATVISDKRHVKVCAQCALREARKEASLVTFNRRADARVAEHRRVAALQGRALAADPWGLAGSA